MLTLYDFRSGHHSVPNPVWNQGRLSYAYLTAVADVDVDSLTA